MPALPVCRAWARSCSYKQQQLLSRFHGLFCASHCGAPTPLRVHSLGGVIICSRVPFSSGPLSSYATGFCRNLELILGGGSCGQVRVIYKCSSPLAAADSLFIHFVSSMHARLNVRTHDFSKLSASCFRIFSASPVQES